MKHKIIQILVLLISVFSFGQEYSNILLSTSETQDIYFYEYSPRLKIKADYQLQSEAVNEYPEQLIQSVLSATNQEWVNYNTLGGEENASQKNKIHFDRIKKMNKENNYFELVHKLTFQFDNVPTVIIKFFIYQEDMEPISGAMLIQKKGNRWYKSSNMSLSNMSIMVMRFKTDVLQGLILGNSTDKEIQALHQDISTINGIDLSSLEKEFFNLYLPENINKKELFIDPKTW